MTNLLITLDDNHVKRLCNILGTSLIGLSNQESLEKAIDDTYVRCFYMDDPINAAYEADRGHKTEHGY